MGPRADGGRPPRRGPAGGDLRAFAASAFAGAGASGPDRRRPAGPRRRGGDGRHRRLRTGRGPADRRVRDDGGAAPASGPLRAVRGACRHGGPGGCRDADGLAQRRRRGGDQKRRNLPVPTGRRARPLRRGGCRSARRPGRVRLDGAGARQARRTRAELFLGCGPYPAP